MKLELWVHMYEITNFNLNMIIFTNIATDYKSILDNSDPGADRLFGTIRRHTDHQYSNIMSHDSPGPC